MILAALLGLLALIAVVQLARWYAEADVKTVKRTLAFVAIGLLAVVALALAATGRIGVALTLFAGLVAWAGRIMSLMHFGRQFRDMFGAHRQGNPRGPASTMPASTMTVEEACRILGVAPNAGEDEIKAAYRRLMAQLHPDHGGNDYLAAKVNEARDFLLKHHGAG